MCGIAGLLGFSHLAHQERQALVEKMGDAIAHRGPDGSGTWLNDDVAFTHRRLSIIDIANGVQPMCSSCDRYVVILNGEIYNYKEIRDGLKNSNYVFRTDSDTEVILALYAVEGIQGFNKMRGMFAFAIWDKVQKVGYLVRDPSGIKPLFYRYDTAGNVEFGSEAKAIIAGNRCDAGLNEQALHKLMNFRYLPDNDSLFRNIQQLPSGAIFCWKDGNFKKFSQLSYSSFESDTDILRALEQSVNIHARADVEIGCYLSGGLDSAIVTALAKRNLDYSLRTFTLDAGDNPMEATYAQQTALEFGLENVLAPMNFSADYWMKLIEHLEVPKINALQVGLIARHTSSHVKVALSGLGGDEIFLGYNAHRWMANSNTLKQYAAFLARPIGAIGHYLNSLCSNQFWTEKERALLIAKNISRPSTVYGLLRNVWDGHSARQTIYGPRMLDANLPNMFDWLESEWPKNADPVLSMREFEWSRKMVNDLLWQEDRCSMAHGLEVRVPFVDPLVKNAAWNLPRHELMKGGKQKALLKESVRPLLTKTILNRKKSGFQIDSPSFFRNELMPLAKEYLSPELVRRAGLFNPKFVEKTIHLESCKQNRWHFFLLYLMLSTHVWLDLFERK